MLNFKRLGLVVLICVLLQGCTALGLVGDARLCEKKKELNWDNNDENCGLFLTYVGLYIDTSIVKSLSEGRKPQNPLDPSFDLKPFASNVVAAD